MQRYLYLSLIPESLIASMLAPVEFGSYYAVGTKKRSRGQALFFEIEPFDCDYFPWDEIERHCIPHPDGRPKRSAYLSVYRVLEHIPVKALKSLYLVTEDGRVLELESAPFEPEPYPRHHLYQEICPLTPRVVSKLNPVEFAKSITDRTLSVSVDRIVFCELTLGRLSRDPQSNDVGDLPYRNFGHLRDCMEELEHKATKATKVVNRVMPGELLYRTVLHGFFVGDAAEFRHYPIPSADLLEREHYAWWRSALNAFGE